MAVDPEVLHAESYQEIGTIIQRDSAIVIERWRVRAVAEQPNASRSHHVALLDHLPLFLHELGRSLRESDDESTYTHCRPAGKHGRQRWETGWSLSEVVRDYQILRLVLVDYLEEALDRPLRSREVMALSLSLDEAIASSVQSYVRTREDYVLQMERTQTERAQQAGQEARRQANALKEVNQRKDEFLALLGHEMRNLLGPAANALHVLNLQKDDPATVEWARDLLERQLHHLTRLLDDLLDVSRIARGKIVLHPERVDLAALVRNTVEDRRASLSEAGLALALDLPAGPVWVEGDPTRLAQVVGNLLHNAVKYTDRGGQVSVLLAEEIEGRRGRITVRDTGIGIEPNLLPLVFDTFMQADRSLERSRGGLGLGLALVKGLVELHGGEVRAASGGVGQGAEFSVSLPLASAPAAVAAPPDPQPAAERPLQILLVEDNSDSAESLRILLELFGHRVKVANTGPAALQTAGEWTPDVVLCDLRLPGMNGYEVAAELRRHPTSMSARLIAISGLGSPADQQRCREAGFDLHLTKPVDPMTLQALLAKLPGRRS